MPEPPVGRLSPTARRVLLLALVAFLIAMAVFINGVHAVLLNLLGAVQSLAADHPVAAALLALLFAAASAMLVFFSTTAIAPFLVYTWGPTTAFLLLWCGWLLGGICSYAIGRFLGRPVVQRLASPRLLASYEQWISTRMAFGLVVLFQLALPSEVPGYLLGLVRYAFPRYLLALSLAELPYAVATVLLGAGVVERRLGLLLPVGAAAALLSVGAFSLLHRRLAAPRAHTVQTREG
jgi:uncharacterized membrane protein YdjX (TVP38/TMEM64 family)